ncbi:SMC family ATPase [Thermosynechococcus sp. PP45]|uniref:AAA family ATPase n=1 Tax=unclassified Thermosynechococcus TaxID=2622553 RepID=UPI002671D8B3|nr:MULTISPECIES: SMC family ATPase [unclassified Thermosynechococcus]WKT80991.1 SMC family ATPase [Thermosynechococcus sp. PP45]WNC24602.1 SMC family ATPase [Thermosynechococcus sp. PP551]WNC27180.1 SMC family ATPase [Thermosynechococcus sp. PP555]
MEIQRLTLKNFKTHRDRTFEFLPGVNVICGENGAGKTSIFEAIAWVLFDATSGYGSGFNKAIIRKGAKRAEATVQFISAADGRSYVVRRNTQTGYAIYDPQVGDLGLSLREDVQVWLQEHLGIRSAFPLRDLFEQIIGIPQGMITADFLKPPAQRRQVFEPILQVSDYRQAFDNALALVNFSQERVVSLERQLAVQKQELATRSQYEQQATALAAELERDRQQCEELRQQCQALATEKQQYEAAVETLNRLAQTCQRLEAQLRQQEELCRDRQRQLAAARNSQAQCQQLQSDYDRYRQQESRYQELEQQLRGRAALEQNIRKLEQQQQKLATQLASIESQRQAIATIASQLAALEPQIAAADALDAEIAPLEARYQQAQQADQELRHLKQQAATLQARLEKIAQQVQALEQQRPIAATLSAKQAERERLQAQLSHATAAHAFAATLDPILKRAQTQATETDPLVAAAIAELTAAQQFALVRPAIEQGLTALQQLQENYRWLLDQLTALRQTLTDPAAIPALNQTLKQLETDIARAAAAERSLLQAQALEEERSRLAAELKQLSDRQQTVEPLSKELTDLERRLNELREERANLGQPHAQRQLLLEQQAAAPQLEADYARLGTEQATLQARLTPLYEERQHYATLEEQRQQLRDELARLRPSYDTYLQHQQQAAQVESYEATLRTAMQAAHELKAALAKAQAEYNAQEQRVDLAALEAVRDRYENLHREYQRLLGAIPEKEKQYQSCLATLKHLDEVATEQEKTLQKLVAAQKHHSLIETAREIFKKSGPRVSEAYLHTVSSEADRLLRELLNRPDVALQWTSDYEIQVNEGGYWRPFKSLSGGEQMCAALAVRLALLRVLVNTDIAFFDEPTTNMDQMRRQQLAESLSNLRSFHQLFVISHDATFEALTEHTIHLERSLP